MTPYFYFLIAYALMVILTARVVFIWFDDGPDLVFAGAFISLLLGVFWPVVWLFRFITQGFANPLKPWTMGAR